MLKIPELCRGVLCEGHMNHPFTLPPEQTSRGHARAAGFQLCQPRGTRPLECPARPFFSPTESPSLSELESVFSHINNMQTQARWPPRFPCARPTIDIGSVHWFVPKVLGNGKTYRLVTRWSSFMLALTAPIPYRQCFKCCNQYIDHLVVPIVKSYSLFSLAEAECSRFTVR